MRRFFDDPGAPLRMTASAVCRTSQSLPLNKGRWHGEAVTKGIYGFPFRIGLQWKKAHSAQSLSQKSEIFASSPYTGEPVALPRQCFAYPLHKGVLSLPLGEVPEGRRGPSQSAKLTAPPKGEPRALPRRCGTQQFVPGNDTEYPPMVLRQMQAVVTHLPPAMLANTNLLLYDPRRHNQNITEKDEMSHG